MEWLKDIKSYSHLCEIERVLINGVPLNYTDFGIKEDIDKESASYIELDSGERIYGCGDMVFIPYKEVKEGVLNKYQIDLPAYRAIQEKLKCLSFGKCDYCI